MSLTAVISVVDEAYTTQKHW